MSSDNVYLIMTLVGHTELFLWRKLTFQQFLTYGIDDSLFHYYSS